MPPMEALYLGTPAIVSNIPAHQEIYQDLPVTFFEDGSVQDLANKMLHFTAPSFEKSSIQNFINQKYNYEITSQKIHSTIQVNTQ